MNSKLFGRQVEDLQARIEVLVEHDVISGADEETLRSALEELAASAAELQGASEELRQQNDQLRAAHEALRAERARYEALFESAPDGYLVTDLHGLIEEANHAASRLLGVQHDLLLGKPLLSYVEAGDRGPFIERLALYRGGGELGRERWQLCMQPRQGGSFSASITTAAVRDPAGQAVGLRWLMRDVTERVRREEQIAFQAYALDQVGDAVVAIDEGERVTYLNRQAAQQYGVDPEQAIGRKLSELYGYEWIDPADEAAAYESLVEQARWRGRNIHVKRDGERIWVESLVTVLLDADGQRTGMLAAMRDVTAQVRAEEERAGLMADLDAERALFRAVFESAPEGVVVADAQGRIVMTNPPANQVYARPVPLQEPYERHAQLEICHPDGTPYDQRQLPLTRAALDGEIADEVRVAIVWPDGQRRELLVNAAPIRSEGGEITGAVGIFQDIT